VTPRALYRYWRQGQTGGRLAPMLIAGTLPGVIAGSFIRVELLPGAHVFDLVVAAVLIPRGVWLVLARSRTPLDRPVVRVPAAVLVVLAGVVGCVGGIYGIGGGAILAPILIGLGRKPAQVAPAALAATFVTSAGGVITFTLLSLHQHLSVAPDWPTGIALGVGGLAGGYAGARIQSRLPELLIRRLVGILVIAIGAYYLSSGVGLSQCGRMRGARGARSRGYMPSHQPLPFHLLYKPTTCYTRRPRHHRIYPDISGADIVMVGSKWS
jgi:uncharacterized protein